MKHRYTMILAAAATLLVLASCELALGPRTEGTIILNLGGGPASRAFSDAPFSGLPVFSSVTVTVSGSGMPTASQTVPGTATSVSLQVPAGPARKVEVYAVPDWAATQLQQGSTPLPTLAKAYGGTTIVDVAGGENVPVSMDMDVVETKILLPDVMNDGYVGISNVLPVIESNDYLSSLSERSDFDFDRFGRLYYSFGSSIQRIDTIQANSLEVVSSENFISGISIDRRNSRLYWIEESEGTEFYFADLTQETPTPIQLFGDDFNFTGSSTTVDSEGFVYIGVYRFSTEQEGIGKVKIEFNGETYSSRLIAFISSADLGTESDGNYSLTVNDMVVHEGRLFLAAGENYFMNVIHHGKLIEVRLADLSKFREIGWSPTTPISNSNTQLYGPTRFLAVLPRKLIFSDEGAVPIYSGEVIIGWNEVDRIIDLDVDSGEFQPIISDPPVGFFSVYVC